MPFLSSPITFDRFARLLIALAVVLSLWFAVSYLSPVLIPFAAAGVLTYLLNPVCNFLQHTCRLRYRVVCVLLTIALAFAVVVGLLWLCVPPIVHELSLLKDAAIAYFTDHGQNNASIPDAVRHMVDSQFADVDVVSLLESDNVQGLVKEVLPPVWALFRSAASLLVSVVASLIGLLYLFFLLLDYERYRRSWQQLVPAKYRPLARQVVGDIIHYMCGYFRGQFFIALSNCVMFTLGFLVIGFPMPVALGCFIGIISFVPYLQLFGILPATLLALLEASKTGENFWLLTLGMLAVYVVVQVIQDTIVTPRVMGHIMGLSPAIVLLALTAGAFVGGIGGLMVSLPLTTIALTYYRRYAVRDGASPTNV